MTFASDPKDEGKTLRAPNGVVQDGREYWSAGKAYYDPARITVPTLLVVAEWDRDTRSGSVCSFQFEKRHTALVFPAI